MYLAKCVYSNGNSEQLDYGINPEIAFNVKMSVILNKINEIAVFGDFSFFGRKLFYLFLAKYEYNTRE